MSVSCRLFIGLTLELGSDLTAADFKKLHNLEDRYPEIDEYTYDIKDKEGKLLLIYDGMNDDFARLIQVDKCIRGGNLGKGESQVIELPAPNHVFNPELITKMSSIYEEYTGKLPEVKDFKYAMWHQWY